MPYEGYPRGECYEDFSQALEALRSLVKNGEGWVALMRGLPIPIQSFQAPQVFDGEKWQSLFEEESAHGATPEYHPFVPLDMIRPRDLADESSL